jgi:hypothetical protein
MSVAWSERGLQRALKRGTLVAPILWKKPIAGGSVVVVEGVVVERGTRRFPVFCYSETGMRTAVCEIYVSGRVKWARPELRTKVEDAIAELKPLLPSLGV